MALSISDFRNATAYPCGNKKECQHFLKEVPELAGVSMYSVRDTLKKATERNMFTKREKVSSK